MFGLFETKQILSDDDLLFQVESFRWLMKHFGGHDFYYKTVLVEPTREFFPAEVSNPEEAAIETFNQVKKFAGMEQWPCELIEQDPDIDVKVSPLTIVQGAPTTPLGTFSAQNETVKITYNPTLTINPPQLVATFAHEIAHYLTATATDEPPGGWDNWEFVTDLAAVFLGFGIFLSNSAFSFQQFTDIDSQGWSYQRSGYLSESELVYALAIFCVLKEIDPEKALKHLKPSLKKLLRRSFKELDARPNLINQIKDVENNAINS